MSNNEYHIDYAPTARATCKFKHCKTKFEKGELRIAKTFPSDRFTDGGASSDFFHPKCWFEAQKNTKKTTKKVESEDDLVGFEDIKEKDKNFIRDLIEHKDDPSRFPKKASKKKTGDAPFPKKPGKKKIQQDYEDEDEDEDAEAEAEADVDAASSDEDGPAKHHQDRNTWRQVAENKSRVARILNSATISKVSVLILASASPKAIQRVAGQDDGVFESVFHGKHDAWLMWLAGNGIVWVSTDFSDAGFNSPGEWMDTLSDLLRQVFLAKPAKGMVVALWGPESKSLKKVAQDQYSALMGTVPYRVVEGPTPLSDSFNATDMRESIDSAREVLHMNAVQWWPFEGEGMQQPQAAASWVLECEEAGGVKVEITEPGETELGRALVGDKRVSRKQCVVALHPNGVQLTPVGVNPMTVTRSGCDEGEMTEKNQAYVLHEGDSFTLLGDQFRFTLRRGQQQATPKPPAAKSQPSTSTSTSTKAKVDTRISNDGTPSPPKNFNGDNKKAPKPTKNDRDVEGDEVRANAGSDQEDEDFQLAKKLQEEETKSSKKKKLPSPDKKRRADENDDEEVDWGNMVKKKPKKGKGSGKSSDADDDDDWVANDKEEDDDDANDAEYEDDEDSKKVKTKGAGSKKPPCKYGAKCYRTNPDHLREFSHPK